MISNAEQIDTFDKKRIWIAPNMYMDILKEKRCD